MVNYIRPSIHLSSDLDEQIKSRGQRSTIISRDLERLYTLYRRALSQVKLTVDEACLIVDALNGSLYTADTARMLWAGIEDACNLDGLDKKWNVDGPQLVQKLKQLNELQCMAIIDAVERVWQIHDQDDLQELVKNIFSLQPS